MYEQFSSVRSHFGDELVADLGELLVLLRLLLHRPLKRGDPHLGFPEMKEMYQKLRLKLFWIMHWI